jgi:hypothetical protein
MPREPSHRFSSIGEIFLLTFPFIERNRCSWQKRGLAPAEGPRLGFRLFSDHEGGVYNLGLAERLSFTNLFRLWGLK